MDQMGGQIERFLNDHYRGGVKYEMIYISDEHRETAEALRSIESQIKVKC